MKTEQHQETNKEEKKGFDQQTSSLYAEVLGKIPSVPEYKVIIEKFLSENLSSQTEMVWNLYKLLLDVTVHTGSSGFFMKLFDLEPYYTISVEEQNKFFLQSNGSIEKAPWREDMLSSAMNPTKPIREVLSKSVGN